MESGKIDLLYHYDAAGRLLIRKDNYGSTVQLLYADVMRPDRLTHIYNFTSHTLTSLLYDERGFLMAMDIGMETQSHLTDRKSVV